MENTVHVYPLGGLYDEFYSPCLSDLKIKSIESPDELKNLNGMFWGEMLTSTKIIKAVIALQNHWRYVKSDNIPNNWKEIMANPEGFAQKVETSLIEIADYATDERRMFGAIECLNYVCKLYTEMFYLPFHLTLLDGFVVPAASSRQLVKYSLVPARNPYLPFLEQHCFPVLKKTKPDILFVHGVPHISTFAVAYQVKLWYPDTHICLCDSSSEYYALNKITDFLMKNDYLSHIADSVLLSGDVFTAEVEEQVKQCVMSNTDIPNSIIYTDGSAKLCPATSPRVTSFKENLRRCRKPTKCERDKAKIHHSAVVSGKLYSNLACPWRKCKFCGINAKYPEDSPSQPLSEKIDVIKELISDGVKYFWFYDEALPESLLCEFAQAVIKDSLVFTWHIRSRLDYDFSPEVCKLLAKSGLREIRFGLETASDRIQKLTNKFEEFSLARIETIVKNFNDAKIGIHFPAIVGFPSETQEERYETYDFLAHLRSTYPMFSFNLNVLELDLASEFYKNSDEFGITDIKLSCPEECFLGNYAERWNYPKGEYDYQKFRAECDLVMQKCLYPWMPEETITQIFEFYRIMENIRITLRLKEKTER
jgi:hypothetical protein